MRSRQQEIIDRLGTQPNIDPAYETTRLVQFLKTYLKSLPNMTSYVLGISGGQDSTLAGKLCQLAINELKQEFPEQAYQFIAVTLPYGIQHDAEDVTKALNFIQPDRHIHLDIQPTVDQTVQLLSKQGIDITDFNKGNIKARERMILQYALAGHYQGLVVGTDHAAERLTGFFTKYGDGAADILPLYYLTKRQGKALLTYLNADPCLYEKIPTADLEDHKPLLPDEEALGISYTLIDDYLEGKEIPKASQHHIEALFLNSEHKRQGAVIPPKP